jgi:hypothetical protein
MYNENTTKFYMLGEIFSKILLGLFIVHCTFYIVHSEIFAVGNFSDQRFGIGRGGIIAKDLDLSWGYNWGNGTYPNQGEETDILNNGLNVFFTVGKLDDSRTFSSDPNYNIPYLETQYLLNQQDRDLYQRLKTVIANISTYSNRSVYSLSSQASFLLVPKYVQDHPGMIYGVANEPDQIPYVSPKDYAEEFNIYYTRIKKYDPTAKIMIKGVSLFADKQSFWDFKIPANCTTVSPKWGWICAFREEYKTKFGEYPPIDIWGIHKYLAPSESWQAARDLIIEFKDNYLTSIGEQSKPIWLLEFGIYGEEGDTIYGLYNGCKTHTNKHGCLTPVELETEYASVVDFMTNLINWLKSTNYVQRWFWYAGGHMYTYSGLDWVDMVYKVPECIPDQTWRTRYSVSDNIPLCTDTTKLYNQEYNPIGVTLQKLADSPKLVNGGFESSGLKPYGFWFWPGGSDSDYANTIVSDEKYSGNQSLKIQVTNSGSPGTNGYIAAIAQTINNNYYAGKRVKFSVWCKTGAGATARLKINITHANGVRDTHWEPGMVTPTSCPSWTQLETPWVTIPSDVVSIETEADTYGQNATAWFDDFNLNKPGDTDGNGIVNLIDLNQVISNFWQNLTEYKNGDFDDNDKINIFDYNIIVNNYGK